MARVRAREMCVPVGLCDRGWVNRATGSRGRAAPSGGEIGALVVERHTDHLRPDRIEHVEQRRKRRVLDDHDVAESDEFGDHPVERIQRAVDDSDGLGFVGPPTAQLDLERTEQRRVDVGRHRDVGVQSLQDRSEGREQRRVRRARAEVELDRPGRHRHLPVATDPRRPSAPHRGAPAAIGSDRTVVLEDAPRVGDGVRTHVEMRGQRSHRGEPVALGEDLFVDQRPDRPGESVGGRLVDPVGDALQHGDLCI